MRVVHLFGAALVVALCSLAQAQSCGCQETIGYAPQSTWSQPISSSPVVYESAPAVSSQVIYSQPVSNGCSSCSTVSYPSATVSYPSTSYASSYTSYPTNSSSIVYESPSSSYASQPTYSTPTYSTPTYSTPTSSTPTYSNQVAYSNSSSANYGTPVSYASYATRSSSTQQYRQSSPYQTVSYQATTRSSPSGSLASIVSVVNQKRARAGLSALRYDPSLMSVAQRKSYYRASRGITGHDGSSMGGARVEGVGWGTGSQGGSNGFNTCYLYSNGYSTCGAAVAYDNSGRAYYTLLLR
jgi:uncharacterized protein YkwD